MEDPRIISALFIFLKMAYYNVLINTVGIRLNHLPDYCPPIGTLTGIWLSASQLFGLFVCLALSYGLIIIVMYITFNWHFHQDYVHNFVYFCYIHIIEFMLKFIGKVEKILCKY